MSRSEALRRIPVLPPIIIEHIKKREEEERRQREQQPVVRVPAPLPARPRPGQGRQRPELDEESDRGVVVIDIV